MSAFVLNISTKIFLCASVAATAISPLRNKLTGTHEIVVSNHFKTSIQDSSGLETGRILAKRSKQPTSHEFNYLGCFKDKESDRALPILKGEGKSVGECNILCESFTFFGRQHKGQCWCGNGNYAKHGQKDECKCDEANVGGWKQCVYLHESHVSNIA